MEYKELIGELIKMAAREQGNKPPIAAPEFSNCQIVQIIQVALPPESLLRKLAIIYGVFHGCKL